MKRSLTTLTEKIRPARVSALARYLLKDEAISGKLIIVAVILALIATNTALAPLYESLWQTKLSLGLGNWAISLDLKHWVNDALMAIFFLVVGLELKRELIKGELRDVKVAVLPIAAAVGGMIVPALLYIAFTAGGEGSHGWAIPMATDIAIVIGILALLGSRIPSSLRLFLLTLAIVDDIAAVVVIALFYSSGIDVTMLGLAAALSLLVIVLHKMRLLTLPVFGVIGIVLWLLIFQSGVHPSIAGALIGLLAPLSVTGSSRSKRSIAERLERSMIPLSTLIVIPLFAFANAGIALSFGGFQSDAALPVAGGVFAGLVVGKVVGIIGASWIVIRFGWSKLPSDTRWNHIFGVGLLAGIGFTVSIFVTELAFDHDELVVVSKMSIFIASLVSGVAGYAVLQSIAKRR